MTISRRALAAASAAAGLMLGAPRLARAAMEPDKDVIVVRAAKGAQAGQLSFAGHTFACAVGRSGVLSPKHEGDGGTPAGRFGMREVRYRPDRGAKPATGLPCFPTLQSDGWCDDPSDPAYNKLVRLPYQTDCESMWRDDHLYDVLGVIGYNDAPAAPGAGSAIFLHVMRPPDADHHYTTGCVALALPDLLTVLAACTPATQIDIRAT